VARAGLARRTFSSGALRAPIDSSGVRERGFRSPRRRPARRLGSGSCTSRKPLPAGINNGRLLRRHAPQVPPSWSGMKPLLDSPTSERHLGPVQERHLGPVQV